MGKRGPKSKREVAIEAYQLARDAERTSHGESGVSVAEDEDTSPAACARAAGRAYIAVCRHLERYHAGLADMDPSTYAGAPAVLRAFGETKAFFEDPGLIEMSVASGPASKR